MIRALAAIAFAVCTSVSIALPARANTCTVPNSLVNGQVVDANALNTNFVALQSCGNNIDSTNVGPAGILASQIISSSAASGTFGGTVGFTFAAKNAGMTPLTVAGVAGQTADIFDVSFSSGGTRALYVDRSGVLNTYNGQYIGTQALTTEIGFGAPVSTQFPVINNDTLQGLQFVEPIAGDGYGWFTLSGVTVTRTMALDNSGDLALLGNVAGVAGSFTGNVVGKSVIAGGTAIGAVGDLQSVRTPTSGGVEFGSTIGSQGLFYFDGTNYNFYSPGFGAATAVISASGQHYGTRGGATTGSYLAPTYLLSGGAVGATLHDVIDDRSCPTNTSGVCTSSPVETFVGAAAFSSSTSYRCTLTGQNFAASVGGQNASGTSWSTPNTFATGIVSGTAYFQVDCRGV